MYRQPALVFIPFYNGPIQEGKEKFKALYDVGPVADMTQEMPYEVINSIQVSLKPCVPAPGLILLFRTPWHLMETGNFLKSLSLPMSAQI